MTFNSFEFLIFLIVVVAAYWRLGTVRYQNLLLLGMSYFFYARWDWRFLSLIVISTVVDYLVGLALMRTEDQVRRRYLLAISLLTNLGILGFFKYAGFFVDSAAAALTSLGLQVNITTLQIVLPVGISFYTFQTLSYNIDIYRRELKATSSFVNFALFVSYFPQLVAGPIERATRLLPQIESPRRITAQHFENGLILILTGLFKKIVIADMAATLINPLAFSSPMDIPPAEVLVAVYLFALQIYGDFSGYSDIARGCSWLMGIDLMENFNQPYFSKSTGEFWRRWHISLSTWFRDYVYIPLNQLLQDRISNKLLLYAVTAMITMLLSGLWHGANWTFVMWGGLLGVFLVASRVCRGRFKRWQQHRLPIVRWTFAALSISLTFHLILISWVFFRAQDIAVVPGIYESMLNSFVVSSDFVSVFLPVVLLYGALFAIDLGQLITRDHSFVRHMPAVARPLVYTGAILTIAFFSIKPAVPFIYFQF